MTSSQQSGYTGARVPKENTEDEAGRRLGIWKEARDLAGTDGDPID